MSIKIFDTIYRFDHNRRVYDKPGFGGRIVYRGHFAPEFITGETKFSWLIHLYDTVAYRVNKATMKSASKGGFGGFEFFTAEGMEDNIWAYDHRHKVAELLARADGAKIRACAKILGYEPAVDAAP